MRPRGSVFLSTILLTVLASTFLLSPFLITQSNDVFAFMAGQAENEFFLLRAYLCLHVLLFVLFCVWVSRISRTYLSAPLLLIVSILLWHFSFTVGFFLYGEGLFGFTGGVFDIGPEQIQASIAFSGLCISCAISGIVYSFHYRLTLRSGPRTRKHLKDLDGSERFSKIVERVGLLGLGLSALILIAYQLIEGRARSDVGYMDLYIQTSGSFIYRLFHSTQFFAVIFALMAWSRKGNWREAWTVALAVLALVGLHFLNGNRSLPFIILVAFVVCYDNFVSRLSFLKLSGIGIALSAVSWIVSQARGSGVGLHVFSVSEGQELNLLHFFWEAGRTQGTVIMTMHFVAQEAYRWGASFLQSTLETIPMTSNVIRSYVHIDRPSEWLLAKVATVNEGQGFGYSLVAEAFLNFGYLGCLLFFFLGAFVGRNYFGFLRTGSRYMYLMATSVAVMLSLHMRNDSGSSLRTLIISFMMFAVLHRMSLGERPKRISDAGENSFSH
ncbi:MAG: O-antigen polysaccharide polymerase Wzy [Deltaproteobacteria bacterium]|nr:O-antigen polysaccharide polymerase Wzy [Deltaproteobacteria bacterium]